MQERVKVAAGQVRALLREQLPHLAGLDLRPAAPAGWDNFTFRLGQDYAVRLPSAARYVPQAAREHRWLPALAPHLPAAVPVPLALGQPGQGYPFPWSVRRWISGTPLDAVAEITAPDLARSLGRFLRALHSAEVPGGPPPGAENFWRGGSLAVYHADTRSALERLGLPGMAPVWERALSSRWQGPPAWLHGDFAPGNLLLRGGRLAGVIDFGQMAAGDPACDLVLAWTHLDARCRDIFASEVALDAAAWDRARGWALWKAAIVLAGEPAPLAQTTVSRRVLARLDQEASWPQNSS